MTMPTYSLWLMPPAGARERLRALIERLSKKFRTPSFEPHVTLTGTSRPLDEVRAPLERYARTLAPVPLAFTDIGYSAEYFRCLYLRAAKNAALLDAYRRACAALGTPEDDFMPHLSLVYGKLAPAAKQGIIAELGRDWDAAFIAARVALYLPAGRPENWRCVADFALRGG